LVVLGVADGLDSGAALVIGEEIVATTTQASLDRTPRSRVFPWGAANDVLEAAGLGRGDVDLVAVAGRFTPPMVLRRFPALRTMAGDDPFSPALDAHVAYQAALRWSGFGAFQEDAAAAWFLEQFRRKGFAPRRVVMVDMHRALADAAYRAQPHDDVIAVTAHPKADGASVAVFRGQGALLVPQFRDSALSALHTHLQRCAAAIGLDPVGDLPLLWAEAGRGSPNVELVERLGRRLTTVGSRPSLRAYPVPDDLPLSSTVYDVLRRTAPPTAAASLLDNLVDALGGVVRTHTLRNRARRVVLGGALFENPRLVARLAEGLDLDELFVLPEPGPRSLPLGAATDQAGVAPRRIPGPGLGRVFNERQCRLALESASVKPWAGGDPVDAAVEILAEGGALARFQGRGGGGAWGGGSRSVLVRADRPDAVLAARAALGRDPREEPGCVWDGQTGSLRDADRCSLALRLGAVALRADEAFQLAHPAVVALDGRVLARRVDPHDEPDLYELLRRLHERTGVGALACWPLATGREPPAARPLDAVRAWRSSGIAALWLGPHLAVHERRTLRDSP
jgi:predicted NodU family carbamoyl transferase